MVEGLRRYGIVKSKKVGEVMERIDRGLFVQSGIDAYIDSPLQIGYNATISAPHMHATCLQLLEQHLQPGMRVLDVGSGSGYLTACFAIMVGPQGRVVGLEHIPELASYSVKNITKSAASSLLTEGSLSVHVSVGDSSSASCSGSHVKEVLAIPTGISAQATFGVCLQGYNPAMFAQVLEVNNTPEELKVKLITIKVEIKALTQY